MLWNPDTILWALASFGFCWHVIHANRMPSLYAAKLTSKGNRFSIPPWVFWVAWIVVLSCDAVWAILFFKDNVDFGTYYQLNAWTFFLTFLFMMEWNWVYFNVICIYAVGLLGFLIAIGHILLLIFTWAYGDQHWFTLLIIAVPIAWTLPAGIFSIIFAYREGAGLAQLKKDVSAAGNKFQQDYMGSSEKLRRRAAKPNMTEEEKDTTPLTNPAAPPSSAQRYMGTNQFRV